MNDRMRVSDADRERVAARLRDHYAEGRLSQDELDERLSAALGARTFGDLRRLTTDLPEPTPPYAQQQAWAGPGAQYRQAQHWGPRRRHGPRIWPLALFALIAMIVLPGVGWLFLAFLKLVLLLWLAAMVVGIVAMFRFRHRARRYWRENGPRWQSFQWHG